MQKNLQEFRIAVDKTITLMSQQKYGEAVIVSKDVAAIRAKLTDATSKLIEIRINHADKMNNSNNAMYEKSRGNMAIISILGFFIAILLGVGISLMIWQGLATREKRSYRDPMSKEKTLSVLVGMANAYEIDKKIVEVVNTNFEEIDKVREKAYKNAILEYEKFTEEFEQSRNSMPNFDSILNFD